MRWTPRHARWRSWAAPTSRLRSARNPLSVLNRAHLLRGAVRDAGGEVRRLTIRPIPDEFDQGRWSATVRAVSASVFGPYARIALVGHEKDAGGAYLRWFPGWTSVPLPGMPGLDWTPQTSGGRG